MVGVLGVLATGCSDSGPTSESAFCERAKTWISSFSEEMTMGERAEWAASASDVREVAPERIHDDLDVLVSVGEAVKEPVFSDDGVFEAPSIRPSEIASAQEKIFSEVEDSCSAT